MKLRTIVKIAIISSVVLLCTGFGVFSFLKLAAAKGQDEFNLFALVPQSATAVIETNDIAGLVQDINDLSCSKDNHYLYISRLFSYLKLHLHTLLDETPHGLSRQMNKMLISFHEPDNDRNQILYCSLGSGDYQVVEKFIKKYCLSVFPSKYFDYKGEEIRIYPMPDDSFLACYFTSDFLVVSYQKKLIEQVIDARLSGKSLMAEEVFARVQERNRISAAGKVYVRMHSLDMGRMADSIRSQICFGEWTEYDMKLSGNAIYFSGISHDTDTCLSFMNMLRKQEPIEGFPGDILPASTFFFSKRSVSDLQTMIDSTPNPEFEVLPNSGYIKARDEELLLYLKENAGDDLVTCLFQRRDTLTEPDAVMSFSMKNITEAERLLRSLLSTTPKEENVFADLPVTFCYTTSKAYPLYQLPRNTLFSQLTGIADSQLNVSACFYGGRLVLAADKESLSSYIHQLDKKEFLADKTMYEDGISGLSSLYDFMIMADLSRFLKQPDKYVRLLPNFFFLNQDFFRHFVFSVQFTCTDGVIYPNIVLLYKGE